MVTSPITTPHFHSRVLTLISNALADFLSAAAPTASSALDTAGFFAVSPLSPADTNLTPEEPLSQIVAVASRWTDLCSPDPFIHDISAQVLKLEIAYAAFCGITHVLLPAPRLRDSSHYDGSLLRYASTILDIMNACPYIQAQIWMPMIDHPENEVEQMGDLAPFTRPHLTEDADNAPQRLDLFGTWGAWDTIRSICKYHSRLCIGKLIEELTFV
jgi:type II protein arginine methyltransferase